MYEVEVKVPADLSSVERALEDAGAERAGEVVQVDTYYDAPHRDFAETDEALRTREETRDGETTTKLTYKGPLVDDESKTREEFETAVADGAATATIFERMGFSPAATVRKDRQFYTLDGYTVTLDDVEGVGEFVEVEVETDEAGVERARAGAFEILELLGLDPADQVRTSYLGLLLENAGE
ncbi:class IV adenylate cyclase [Halomicroarcula sp. GCM10025324]|uniref:class IV adenylate cyclase n=1 Tax=Haloarcula TaxID=2237 RepID=UPI0023E8BD29|nr:class IV adenylate cyclase [Halomicroarcula sp. ZS-22-S1]